MASDDPRGRVTGAAGSTNPFDFADEPTPLGLSASSRPGSSPAPRSAEFDPFGLSGGETAARPRAGQRLSWVALILAIVGALAIGFGVGGALSSIRLTAHAPFGAVLWWGTLALAGFLLILIGLIGGIVGLIQAEPRRVAGIALLVSIVAGWIAAYLGFRVGAHQLGVEAVRVVGTKGPEAVPAIESYLRHRGIDVGAYSALLHRVFG